MQNRVRIKLVSPTTQKLAMVKIVKNYTGLGLKEAKDIVDTLHAYPNKSIEIDLSKDLVVNENVIANAKSFSKALDGVDGTFLINGGVQYERNKKILDLGIGTEEDYSDFITEYMFEKTPSFVKDKFSKLKKDQLEEIYKILTEDDSNS